MKHKPYKGQFDLMNTDRDLYSNALNQTERIPYEMSEAQVSHYLQNVSISECCKIGNIAVLNCMN